MIDVLLSLVSLVAADSCDNLRSYSADDVTVIEAVRDSGQCVVEGVITPVEGSRIGFTLRLPSADDWNSRLKMFGNGGYSSDMPLEAVRSAATAGYAAVATDTGHAGDDPSFVVGRPEALRDWAYRAVHATVIAAKGLAEEFYGHPAEYSYFEGCSTGGHQALSEVQRYPEDFDGVIAGAPGHNRIRLNAAFLSQFLINRRPDDPATPILPKAALPWLSEAARAACDTDPDTPYIDDPLSCAFDPGVLRCTASRTTRCLTAEQVDVARAMYGGTRDPRSGALIYPPWLPGSEAGGPVEAFPGWSLYWADPRRGDVPARQSFWRFWVFEDPSWTFAEADLGRDVAVALEKLSDTVDATETDLSAFARAGGKLLHYHGLADPVVSPLDSTSYFDAVQAKMGGRADDFYRLFLLPGVEHCRGGLGPDRFDAQKIIESWVEDGNAPQALMVHPANPEEQGLALKPYETPDGENTP